jgi:2-keto-3-deoxy-L-fuconate dehydrogenase
VSERLKGKTCVVTAAGQGIGRANAGTFAQEGEAWAPAAGVQMRTLDAADAAAVEALAAEFPATSVVVNCVGLVAVGTVLDCSPEELERSFRINVVTMAHTVRAFLPRMRQRRDGSIINIASVASSVMATPNRFAYATTKAAVIGFTKSVALDFVAEGIRCNSISPGTVESPSLHERMAAQGDVEKARAAFVARQPMGRIGAPREIAAVALLMASDEARFMTGENVIIDGGMSL